MYSHLGKELRTCWDMREFINTEPLKHWIKGHSPGLKKDYVKCSGECKRVWHGSFECQLIRTVKLLFFLFFTWSGAKLDDFADFTTFGIATSLFLRTPELMDNILCMCYVLSVFVRLCFFSSGRFKKNKTTTTYNNNFISFNSVLKSQSLSEDLFYFILPQGYRSCTVDCPASTPQPSWPVPPCCRGGTWPCCGW